MHQAERVVLSDCTTCHAGITASHGNFSAVDSRGVHASPPPPPDPSGGWADDAGALLALREAGAPASAFLGHDAGAHAALTPSHALPGQVCSTCHAPHAAKEAARATCVGCHAQSNKDPRILATLTGDRATLARIAPAIEPRGKNAAGHPECITCHEPHRAKRADVRACEGCHADRREVASNKGHATCTGCHAPHAPGEARASCNTCHAGKAALASTLGVTPRTPTRVTAHAACESCHDPHKPNVSPAAACQGCHTNVKPTHPPGKTGTCTGCHTPHPTAPPTAAKTASVVACSSCHTKASNDHGFHSSAVTCKQCHAPHRFALAQTRSSPAAGAAFCSSCHAPKAALTSKLAGHADCRGCHAEPHTPVKKPGCAKCHAQETATAPKGHADCQSCHEPHSGSLGEHKVCTSCHATKEKALHAQLGCQTCHRPHGPNGKPTPPTCASCHTKLPGLHSVGPHAASCQSCHSSHGPPRSDRATCTTTCHTDRRNHQPQAPVCKGCHLFRN